MTITHVYFDWSGTLARPGTRETFIHGNTKQERLSCLYPESLYVLKMLVAKGYTLGIISNTDKTREEMIQGLGQVNLLPLFKGAVVLSSDDGLCLKPCEKVFKTALAMDEVPPGNAIMIGDTYIDDIIGARNVGMHAIYINREHKPLGGFPDLLGVLDLL